MGEEVGFALRRVRIARGLTLKQVGERSSGAFKPTAVACYERAERTISLERFYELCEFYGVAPAQMLAEIEEAIRGRPELIVDLTRLDTTWRQYRIPFGGLTQRNFGLPRERLDPASIYTVEFQFATVTPVDFWVDDVAFY